MATLFGGIQCHSGRLSLPGCGGLRGPGARPPGRTALQERLCGIFLGHAIADRASLERPDLQLSLFLSWTKSYIAGMGRILEKAIRFRQR